ncbi:MAG: hypothetical protein A4E55_00223 [Pelotomaculum sp. PtaU1.Bin035]|nr:MAG: hypothetical protein A4E55_00223 [Pelotomaculum sp. PtaU1.Bin035]
MTIVMSALTPGGIVMAGEGRAILAEKEDLCDGFRNPKLNHGLLTDNEEKVFLIADKFGLMYSGPDSNDQGWCLRNEITEFDRIVRLNLRSNLSFNVLDAGEILNEFIKKALPPEMGYSFYWAGYSPRTKKPFQVFYRDGQEATKETRVPRGFRMDIPGYPDGCYEFGMAMSGVTEVIKEFIGDKVIRWGTMPLRDAIECVEFLVTVGIKGIKFFEGYQQLSGGDIDILVITPTFSGFVKHKTLSLFGGGVNVGA